MEKLASTSERFVCGVVFHLDQASRENGVQSSPGDDGVRTTSMLAMCAFIQPECFTPACIWSGCSVDSRKINLFHNFGGYRPPAVQDQRLRATTMLSLASCIRHSTYCQRTPRWFLSFGFELNASFSWTIQPASPLYTTYFRSNFPPELLTMLPCHVSANVLRGSNNWLNWVLQCR